MPSFVLTLNTPLAQGPTRPSRRRHDDTTAPINHLLLPLGFGAVGPRACLGFLAGETSGLIPVEASNDSFANPGVAFTCSCLINSLRVCATSTGVWKRSAGFLAIILS